MLSWCSPSSVWRAAASLAKRAASGPTAGDTASEEYRSLLARMRTWCSSSSEGSFGSCPTARRRSRQGGQHLPGRGLHPIRLRLIESRAGRRYDEPLEEVEVTLARHRLQ